jgi:hypothetical protein
MSRRLGVCIGFLLGALGGVGFLLVKNCGDVGDGARRSHKTCSLRQRRGRVPSCPQCDEAIYEQSADERCAHGRHHTDRNSSKNFHLIPHASGVTKANQCESVWASRLARRPASADSSSPPLGPYHLLERLDLARRRGKVARVPLCQPLSLQRFGAQVDVVFQQVDAIRPAVTERRYPAA